VSLTLAGRSPSMQAVANHVGGGHAGPLKAHFQRPAVAGSLESARSVVGRIANRFGISLPRQRRRAPRTRHRHHVRQAQMPQDAPVIRPAPEPREAGCQTPNHGIPWPSRWSATALLRATRTIAERRRHRLGSEQVRCPPWSGPPGSPSCPALFLSAPNLADIDCPHAAAVRPDDEHPVARVDDEVHDGN